MKLFYTDRFRRSYEDAPEQVKRAFAKQARLLTADLRHPGLHAKKYDASKDIWQARVNRSWRFYFQITGDTYYLLDIIPHPK